MDISSLEAYYSFSALLNLITSLVLITIVLITNARSSINRIFNIFMALIGFWSLFYFLWLNTNDMKLADFYLRTCMIGVIFMPPTFTHFVTLLSKQDAASTLNQRLNNKSLLVGNYITSLLFATTVYTPLFAKEGGAFNVFPYWAIPGHVFPFHLVHFFLNFLYAFYLILYPLRQKHGNHIFYAFIGILIGFLGGTTNYLYWYRISIIPVLNIFVFVFLLHIYVITKIKFNEER
jgi:hypothetical protein